MIVFPFHSWSTHLWNSVIGLLAFIMLVLDSWAFVSCVQQSSTIPQNMRGQTAFFSLLHSLPQSPWGFACCGQFCVFILLTEKLLVTAQIFLNSFGYIWEHVCIHVCGHVCATVYVCVVRGKPRLLALAFYLVLRHDLLVHWLHTPDQGTLPYPSPTQLHWDYRCALLHTALCAFWGSQLKSPRLCGTFFAISSALLIAFSDKEI